MDGMLSQEEINALLNGMEDSEEETKQEELLTESEKDIIGEISNISMGTAATTLFSLVNNKVTITTPKVSYCQWNELEEYNNKPCIFVQIFYKEGLDGNNILLLKERDAKVITDLMMGGDGSNLDSEFSELHVSAISEAMNQMIGSSSTSLSSMLGKTIDINPPITNLVDFQDEIEIKNIADFLNETFIKVSFRMEIGDLVDSEIMQLYPMSFAKELYNNFIKAQEEPKKENVIESVDKDNVTESKLTNTNTNTNINNNDVMNSTNNNINSNNAISQEADINVRPAAFQAFDMASISQQKENIDLIMDVPLEVTVQLGRTQKSIREILEFAPGTILELNKLAGEPVDVLVNGKLVSKGEVVVIEENFGIRITDIIK